MLGQAVLEQFGQGPLRGVLMATRRAFHEVSAHGLGGGGLEVTSLVLQELGADLFAAHAITTGRSPAAGAGARPALGPAGISRCRRDSRRLRQPRFRSTPPDRAE